MKTLIVVLLSCLLHSCSVAEETTCTHSSARVTSVQCDFGDSLCDWENDAKGIEWIRRPCGTHPGLFSECTRGYYVEAEMHRSSIGKKARLVSSQLCSTGFIYYQLNFRYAIACASDQCRLSVILRSDFNDSEQVLWKSTQMTGWQGYRNDTIQPEAGDFTIIFHAEKVGNYDRSSYIGITNISFTPAGSVTTITPSTSTAAYPTTQTTTKAFTSTTMVAQRTDKQTRALTEQTSLGGTSLQTSPTWAGDSDTQKENDGKDSDARVIVAVAVSVIVVIVVVAAAIVILIFMRRGAKKPKTTAEHLRPGVMNAAYSQ